MQKKKERKKKERRKKKVCRVPLHLQISKDVRTFITSMFGHNRCHMFATIIMEWCWLSLVLTSLD